MRRLILITLAVLFAGSLAWAQYGCSANTDGGAILLPPSLEGDTGASSDADVDGDGTQCPDCTCNCDDDCCDDGDVICECSAEATAECDCCGDGDECVPVSDAEDVCDDGIDDDCDGDVDCDDSDCAEDPACAGQGGVQICHEGQALSLTEEQVCEDHVFTADLTQEQVCEAILSLNDPTQGDINALLEYFGVHQEDYFGLCDDDFAEFCIESCFEVNIALDGVETELFSDCEIFPLKENIIDLDGVIMPTIFYVCFFDVAWQCQTDAFQAEFCREECKVDNLDDCNLDNCTFAPLGLNLCYTSTCEVAGSAPVVEVDCPELDCDDDIDNDNDGDVDCDDSDCAEDYACARPPPVPTS